MTQPIQFNWKTSENARTDQVVKIFRNWAIAKAKNAEIKGRFSGSNTEDEDDEEDGEFENDAARLLLIAVASATVITSSIVNFLVLVPFPGWMRRSIAIRNLQTKCSFLGSGPSLSFCAPSSVLFLSATKQEINFLFMRRRRDDGVYLVMAHTLRILAH